MELVLQANGIGFTDGFGEQIDAVRYWDSQLLDDHQAKVRLLKLHGSIDWWWTMRHDRKRVYSTVKIRPGVCQHAAMGIGGKLEQPAGSYPQMLIGTVNKDLRYVSDIFFQLQCDFYRSLKETKFLVVAGYGFQDHGINQRVFEWAESDADRKLIIINPDPKSLRARLKYGTFFQIGELEKDGRLRFIPRGIKEVTWQEIVEKFNDS